VDKKTKHAAPDPTSDYARAVVAGDIVAGRLARLASDRIASEARGLVRKL
jgi:hypothetical protein